MPLENFPYTNFHDLNLDWIISRVRHLQDQMNNLDPATVQQQLDAFALQLDAIAALAQYALVPLTPTQIQNLIAELGTADLSKIEKNVAFVASTADGWLDLPTGHAKDAFINLKLSNVDYLQIVFSMESLLNTRLQYRYVSLGVAVSWRNLD